jgi:voltage-gated potassium channel
MIPLSQIIVLLLSPTRLVIDRLKDSRKNAQSKALLLLKWNHGFFWYDVLVAFALGVVSSLLPPPYVLPHALGWVFFIVAYSRCNEIAAALLHDVGRELDLAESSTALTTGQRIKMAMRSYVGLVINFGVIYYFLPNLFSAAFFAPALDNFVDALYFSGVTITTLGYGDIKPDHAVTKLLVLYELFSGLLLVVVALSVYLSAHGYQRKKQ